MRLSLAELRSTTSSLETVLLSFLHSRVTSEETSSLKCRTELCVILEQGTGDTVTDRTSLTGYAAALYSADHVELFEGISQCQRLTNDELESLKTEVIVDASAVDSNVT